LGTKVLISSRFSYLKIRNLEKDLITQIENFLKEGKLNYTYGE